MRCRGANCPNVAALFGLSITGVMSNITAVADFVRESKTGLGIPGRMGIRSDLQPLYKLPLLDNFIRRVSTYFMSKEILHSMFDSEVNNHLGDHTQVCFGSTESCVSFYEIRHGPVCERIQVLFIEWI